MTRMEPQPSPLSRATTTRPSAAAGTPSQSRNRTSVRGGPPRAAVSAPTRRLPGRPTSTTAAMTLTATGTSRRRSPARPRRASRTSERPSDSESRAAPTTASAGNTKRGTRCETHGEMAPAYTRIATASPSGAGGTTGRCVRGAGGGTTSEPPGGGERDPVVPVELPVEGMPRPLEDVGADRDGHAAAHQPLEPRAHAKVGALGADDEEDRGVQRVVEESRRQAQRQRGRRPARDARLRQVARRAGEEPLAELQRGVDVPEQRDVDADQVVDRVAAHETVAIERIGGLVALADADRDLAADDDRLQALGQRGADDVQPGVYRLQHDHVRPRRR